MQVARVACQWVGFRSKLTVINLQKENLLANLLRTQMAATDADLAHENEVGEVNAIRTRTTFKIKNQELSLLKL